jgi:hypothetical protein
LFANISTEEEIWEPEGATEERLEDTALREASWFVLVIM